MIAHVLAKINSKKGAKVPQPLEFFGKKKPAFEEAETPEQSREALTAWAMNMTRGKLIISNPPD